jgi:16S rRNA (adenine1518-N6/adenine1519-N6)-dimethyltransferase
MTEFIQAKKALGQHWLGDDFSLQAMCDAVDLQPDDVVLEIGPGPGTLTEKLVRQAKEVVAVEFDKDLARDLPKRVPAENLRVINQDILQFDLRTMPDDYKIVANIPYYLTSKLLRILCESQVHFSRGAILIQKEVAERVCAKPGDMSLLSVSVQFYCEASLGELVPARLFTPPPKVDSQILQLTYRAKPLFDDVDEKLFFRVVKAGFSQRRKTLLNSLSAGLNISRDQTTDLLQTANISPTARAQTLTLTDWHNLTLVLDVSK